MSSGQTRFPSSFGSARLAWIAIGIAAIAIAGSFAAGSLAYTNSRRAVMDSAARDNLSICQTIVNNVQHEVSQGGQASDKQRVIEQIAAVWERTVPPYPETDLCVIDSTGKLALHTGNPKMRGKDVSALIVNPDSSRPMSVAQLMETKGDLAILSSDFGGIAQVVGYAYMPSIDSLIVAHVPAQSVEDQIRGSALPWVIALALVGGLLIPLSVGLLHHGYTTAQRAVQTASATLQANEQDLRESEARFRTIFEQAAVGVAQLNSVTGVFLSINRRYCEILGMSAEDLLGKPWMELTQAEDLPGDLEKMERLRAGEICDFAMERRLYRSDGSFVWINLTVSPMWQPGTEPSTHIAIVEDISERKRAEIDSRLRDHAFASSTNGIVIVDATVEDLPIIYCNPAFERLTGYPQDEVLGRNCRFLQGTDRNQAARTAIRAAVQDGREVSTTLRNYRKDGTMFWCELHISPVRDADRCVTHFLGFQYDVTERIEAEQALLESRSLYADLYENAPDMMASIDPANANVVQCNRRLVEVLGRPKEQIIGRPVFDILSSESAEQVRSRVFPEFVATGRVESEELTLNCADGTTRDVILNATAVRDAEGAIINSRSVLRDVTDQKKAAEALRQSEELFRRLVETAPFGVRRNDLDGRITFANEALGKIFACEPEEMVGEMIWDFAVDDADREQMEEHFRRHVSDPRTDSTAFETKRRARDGRIIDVTIDWTHDCDRDGNVIGLIVIVTDITTRKRAEQEKRQHRDALAHMTRLSTMGELVAGIAHEVRQPLYAITNFATAAAVSLRNVQQSGSMADNWLEEMKAWNNGVHDASKRANEIIQRLRQFARKGKGQRERINIGHLIRDSIELVAFEARQCQAMVQTELADGLADVVADRIQCEQVLVNLLHNAYEALADFDSPRRVTVRAKPSDDFVEVQIVDNGPGIPSDQNGKLFEAFYTTKPAGMGMGLAISQTIVEDHGGRLWGRANRCGGATFHFTLPIVVKQQPLQLEDA